jgi:hypothetical protein
VLTILGVFVPSPVYQKVLVYKTSFMQQIGTYVHLGYEHWCAGVCEPSSAAAWASKAARYYRVDLDRNRRAREKKAGRGCAVLLMHELNGEGKLAWVLLVTSGTHPAHQLERLHSAYDPDHRIVVGNYELIRLSRAGQSKPSLSWRFTQADYDDRRRMIIDTVRRGSTYDVRRLIVSLYRSPGFAPIRRQVGKCCALIRSEYKRSRPNEPLPEFPTVLPYVSRIRAVSVPLNVWLSAQALKAKSIAAERQHTSENSAGPTLL